MRGMFLSYVVQQRAVLASWVCGLPTAGGPIGFIAILRSGIVRVLLQLAVVITINPEVGVDSKPTRL